MGDIRIEDYVRTLNQLYKDTGLLIESNINLYEVNTLGDENKVIAEIKWDEEEKEYYPRYKH